MDAYARAMGTRKDTAVRIGRQLFSQPWSAQILRIYVDGIPSHQVAGIVLSGVKFHRPLSRLLFVHEVVTIVAQTFAAAPVEEVDLWCVVPLTVGKGAIVSGDLAQPTDRTVFAVTVRRGEAFRSVRTRIDAGRTVYWDALWARGALRS